MSKVILQDKEILYVRLMPARLSVEQIAVLVGASAEDIGELMKEKLIRPLGNPPSANCTKYFSSAEILRLATDRTWLSRMQNVLYRRTQRRNHRIRRVVERNAV